MKINQLKLNELWLLKILYTGRLLCNVQIRDIIWHFFSMQMSYTSLNQRLKYLVHNNMIEIVSTIDTFNYYQITNEGKELVDSWEENFSKLGE
jgi:DNA-binding PadR family transcriptional regulator